MINDFRPFKGAMAKLSTGSKTIEAEGGSTATIATAIDKKRRIDSSYEIYLGLYQALTGPEERQKLFDLRGHGGSSQPGDYSLELMRSDVLGFLHTLNLDEVTVIGHSLGGAVAYLVAEAEPGLVRQLVLEEPPPPFPATPPRVVPSKPSDPLPFDWRMLGAIAHQRNHPDPAWWEDRISSPHAP